MDVHVSIKCSLKSGQLVNKQRMETLIITSQIKRCAVLFLQHKYVTLYKAKQDKQITFITAQQVNGKHDAKS